MSNVGADGTLAALVELIERRPNRVTAKQVGERINQLSALHRSDEDFAKALGVYISPEQLAANRQEIVSKLSETTSTQ